MRRRLAASGAIVFALLFPLASASADSLFPLTGRYAAFSAAACTSDLLLCTGADIWVNDTSQGFGMCIEIRHSSEGIVYETEYGCWDGGLRGKLLLSNKLLVGMGASTIAVLSDLTGQYRDVTFSVDTAISTNVATGTDGGTLIDSPTAGCTTTWSGKSVMADSHGTTSMGGDSLETLGILETWQTKSKTRCG